MSGHDTGVNSLAGTGCAAVAALCWLASCASAPPKAAAVDAPSADRFVYVGTYTGPGVPPDGHEPSTAGGIYVSVLTT
jgi:hypothetical protein